MRILSRISPAARKTSRNEGRGRFIEITLDQEFESILVRAWTAAGQTELRPHGQGTDCAAGQLPADLKLRRKPAGINSANKVM
jgi:hypothetical protein